MSTKGTPIIRFLGVRGSRPIHVGDFLTYGGNTTSIEIDTGLDFLLAIDAGTGLQHLNKRMKTYAHRKLIHILITHSHWDHVLFLPLLKHLSDLEYEIHIHAPDVGNYTFDQLFDMLLKAGRLPIPTDAIKRKPIFHRINPGQTFLIENKIKVSTFQVNHQHITLGYKLGFSNCSVGIITDTALMTANNILGQTMMDRAMTIGLEQFTKEYNEGLINFLRGVDCLVFDTHFNESNVKIDWGHATPELALDVCRKAKISRLFMFHHAPEDNDQQVAIKQHTVQQKALPFGIQVINAREEDEWPILSA